MKEKQYRGIEWSRREQCYKSYVMLNGKKHLCGIFVDIIPAVKARDLVILKHGLKVPLQYLKPLAK